MSIDLNLANIDPQGIGPDLALEILRLSDDQVAALFPTTTALREKYFGRKVKLCSIVNAKSGACPEVCGFCPQSSEFKGAESPLYPLMKPGDIASAAADSEHNGSREFSIVTSGRGMSKEHELEVIEEALHQIGARTQVEKCASLGLVDKPTLQRLKGAGLTNYHHNLETARSFFPNIVKTHSYDEEVQSVREAKEIGLKVCSGGIFGMGESLEQRVEFIFEVKALEVDNFPINFLNPRPGTPLEDRHDLSPYDCLRIIAAARLAMPKQNIFVLGGREVNLKDRQAEIFLAGANGTMVGNYLTTLGTAPDATVQMIEAMGLEIDRSGIH